MNKRDKSPNNSDWQATGNEIIDAIAEAISPDLARLLVATYPGSELFVPQKVGSNHHLVIRLGPSNADKLAALFSGETIYVPKNPIGDRQRRNDRIRELIEDGVARQEIALEVGVTQRQLRRLLAEWRKDEVFTSTNRCTRAQPRKINSNGPLTGVRTPKRSLGDHERHLALMPPHGAVCGTRGYYLPIEIGALS